MTQVSAPFSSKTLRMARVIRHGGRAPIELTSAKIKIARHMAQDGHTLEDIRSKLELSCSLGGLRNRLRALNIKPRNSHSKRAHRGDDPYLAPHMRAIDFRLFRVRA